MEQVRWTASAPLTSVVVRRSANRLAVSNDKLREERLNEHCFLTLDDPRETIENWRIDSNRVRPHISLGCSTPENSSMGYANVESETHFPHSHSPDRGGVSPLLNSTSRTLTYPD